MRPISLTMEGFTSFARRTEIDFSSLDLFAITGPTGSGKTSILDAMTWALYGRTSRLGKTSTDLISHGTNKISVHLEFAAGGQRYRIARTAKRTGSPQIRLEKYAAEWIPVDATNAAEINGAVCRIVGLDFEAFTRSVILPQGRFDAFLRGEYKDRREILKSLLGLDVYDRMHNLAAQKKDRLRAEVEARQSAVEREFTSATGENLQTLRVEFRQTRQQQEENSSQTKLAEQLEGIARELSHCRNSLAEKSRAVEVAEEKYLEECAVARKKGDEACIARHAMERLEAELTGVVVDDARHARLLTLKERAGTLGQLAASQASSLSILATVSAELERKSSDLAAAHDRAKRAKAHSAAAGEACLEWRKRLDASLASGSADLLDSLAERLMQVPMLRQSTESLERQKADLAGTAEALRERLTILATDRLAAQGVLDDARNEQAQLLVQNTHRALRAGLTRGEECPVCEQPVAALPPIPTIGELESVRARVKGLEHGVQQIQSAFAKAESQIESLPERVRDLDDRIRDGVAAVGEVLKRVYSATGELSDIECRESLQRGAAVIREAQEALKKGETASKQADSAARLASEEAARLDREVAQLSERASGIEQETQRVGARIDEIRPEIVAAGGRERISADLETIARTKQKRDTLAAQIRTLAGDLRKAQDCKSEAEKAVAVLNERKNALRADASGLEITLAGLTASWSRLEQGFELPADASEVEQARNKRAGLENDRIRISNEIVRLDAALKDVETKITQLADLQKELDALRVECGLYEQLYGALRATGFIAYLLETAYSDLCTKGSDYLMRFTHERYSFTAGKSEFCVKDAWNGDAERSASTLSGGESFLASLALALALADSVASFGAEGSPGAKLEALFLDEGVSTLDQDETLPTVIDALIGLQSGDRLIGVISHMENLAERLPARIEIVTNKGRSSIRAAASAIMRQSA